MDHDLIRCTLDLRLADGKSVTLSVVRGPDRGTWWVYFTRYELFWDTHERRLVSDAMLLDPVRLGRACGFKVDPRPGHASATGVSCWRCCAMRVSCSN